MSLVDQAAPDAEAPARGPGVRGALGSAAALLLVIVVLAVVSAWHLTQGTTGVGLGDLLGLLVGRDRGDTWEVLVGSRVPRLLAGLVAGFALGAAGAIFQSLARNALASPDTLAVNAGAYFAATLVASFGLTLPLVGNGFVAFLGALAAAGCVLLLAGGGATSTTRLILAGTALAMALDSGAGAFLLLFEEETTGLFAWGKGTLSQTGLGGVERTAPVVAVALALSLLLARRLDLIAVDDDTAHVLGVPVRRTRVLGVLVAVTMCSAAVTVAGPIGFVGLCAPAAVRLVARAVPGVARHAVLVPLSGLAGSAIVLGADALMRQALGEEDALAVPTGTTTTMLGAVVLVLLARRARDAGPTRRPPSARLDVGHSRLGFLVRLSLLVVLVCAAALTGLLGGYSWLLTGDLVNWVTGNAVSTVEFALAERSPRVVAALAAGAALALSGTAIQAVARNPLAEPGLLGITGGAGVAAVIMVTSVPGGGSTAGLTVAAGLGSLVAFGVVYGLTWRGGLDSDRLVLVGIGVWAFTTALSALLIIRASPWDTPKIFTWMSGSTWDRSWGQVLPVLVALAVFLPAVWLAHRQLDLLALDDDTPRLVGVRLERTRLLVLLASAVLASTAVSAVGVVIFVGLVAPHAARGLVAGRHVRVVPVAVLVGALLLSAADTLGRTAITPHEIPAGLVVAGVGAPYFLYLLWRSRA